MTQYLGLRFRDNGQLYSFDAGPFEVKPGDHVLVKSDQGLVMARVHLVQDTPPQDLDGQEIKAIHRPASDEDMAQHAENLDMAREAVRQCRHLIEERGLDMKLVDVEVFHDRSKLVFYFTAPGRIDFRELVKDLVKTYRTRIELRQIGVRHETQMIGAIGNCGQVCCCAQFIRKFQPVTIKMAKEQNLFLNPAKISGMCGRLLCCLAYEQSNYEDFQRNCPKFGKKYQTSQGPVKVLRSNIFRETISVITEENQERELTLEEWRQIAGEHWTPYIPPQGHSPHHHPPREHKDKEATAPERDAQTDAQAGAQAGEAVPAAPSEPGDEPKAKPKRKRKRKARPRRHDAAVQQSGQEPGE